MNIPAAKTAHAWLSCGWTQKHLEVRKRYLRLHRPREIQAKLAVGPSISASAFARFRLRSWSVECLWRPPKKQNKLCGIILIRTLVCLAAEGMRVIYQRSKQFARKTARSVDNTSAASSRFCFIIKLHASFRGQYLRGAHEERSQLSQIKLKINL